MKWYISFCDCIGTEQTYISIVFILEWAYCHFQTVSRTGTLSSTPCLCLSLSSVFGTWVLQQELKLSLIMDKLEEPVYGISTCYNKYTNVRCWKSPSWEKLLWQVRQYYWKQPPQCSVYIKTKLTVWLLKSWGSNHDSSLESEIRQFMSKWIWYLWIW